MNVLRSLPVFKSGDPHDFSNYRPISLLPTFSKLLERVVYNQLYPYFDSNFFTPFQFGFRKGHNTVHCILNFLHNQFINADKKFHIGIFLDLKKAFDTVSHDILLAKLLHYGLSRSSMQWIENYLSNRSQIVSYNSVSSSAQFVNCGVPQGSILGPLLFLIYINDFSNCSNFDVNLFADDTTLQFSSNSLRSLEEDVNLELNHVMHWYNCNKLSLNASKSNIIKFYIEVYVLKVGKDNEIGLGSIQ
ncbi:MAG: reverse transcriptase family protein [Bacteroidota bacterium]